MSRFLVLEAVLGHPNNAWQLLLSNSYLLTPFLNFLGIDKSRYQTMRYPSWKTPGKQTIVFYTL